MFGHSETGNGLLVLYVDCLEQKCGCLVPQRDNDLVMRRMSLVSQKSAQSLAINPHYGPALLELSKVSAFTRAASQGGFLL